MPKKKTERMVTNWEGMPIAGYDKCGNCINEEELDEWDRKQKKKKKQGKHYIYVARDKDLEYKEQYSLGIIPFTKCYSSNKHYFYFTNETGQYLTFDKSPIYKNLKKGEQVRIPIDIEKAEKV